MKITTFSVASFAFLLQLASAQPLKEARHAHAALHQKHKRVDPVEVIVYVDQNGNQLSSTTSSPPSSNPAPPEALDSDLSTPETSSPKSYGLSYSPYSADGSCKTGPQVEADFAVFGPSFPNSYIRTYGVDCDQVATVLSAAKKYNMRLFLGIYDINSIPSEVDVIVKAVQGDWSRIGIISVGNELVNSAAADVATVVSAIGTARTLLRAAGFKGAVGTVDTLIATRSNPELAHASDQILVNCHPFFDSKTAASDAGTFLTTMIDTLKTAVNDPSKKIMIAETGWPTAGTNNDRAMPGLENQETALAAIKSVFADKPEDVVLFAPFNAEWKTNSAGQFWAEKSWGFWRDRVSASG